MSHGVQVGFGRESSAKPAGMVRQPESSRAKRRQRARSTLFSKVNSSRDWVSMSLELSNSFGEEEDRVWHSLKAVHGIVLALRRVRCFLPRVCREESLSLSRGD